jgi:hypothetical protein
MTNPAALVSKLCNYCSILRDDGLSYGDCVEQLTVLLLAPFRSGVAQRQALPVSAALRLLKMAGVDRRLSVMEELEAVVMTNRQRATRLRQCILQKAFAGELTAND